MRSSHSEVGLPVMIQNVFQKQQVSQGNFCGDEIRMIAFARVIRNTVLNK